MASFTPASPLHFNYKHLFPQLTQPQQVVYENSDFGFVPGYTTQHEVFGLPAWLEVQNTALDEDAETYTFTLKVKESVAEALADGDYQAQIKVRWKIPTQNIFTWHYSSGFTVTLDVDETIELSISPTTLSFGTYIIGSSAPQNQVISIQAENNWQLVAGQSWVTLSQTSGSGNALITVGVDTSGLTAGQYQALLTLTDGFFNPVYATVTITISEGDTESTYIYPTPRTMQFISELAVENTTTKALNLEASHAWTAVVSETWLEISATSGSSGVQTLLVSVDSEALTDTSISYLASITFTCQDIVKTVFVELFLVEFLLQGINSDTLYFSEDRNELQATNINPNMFLYLELIASNGLKNYQYNQEAPFVNGLAKILIGLETNHYLKHVTPINTLASGVRNNIKPIDINFSAFNKNKFNASTSLLKNFQNVKFLTGKTPEIDNKLCYTPDTVYMSKNGVLSITALATPNGGETTVTVYNENLQESGGEWDTSSTGVTVLDSTDEASSGTKSIKFPGGGAQTALLNISTPITVQNGLLKFKFKQPSVHNYNIRFVLGDSNAGIGYPTIFINGSGYGIDPNSTDWQQAVVPIYNVTTINEISIKPNSDTIVFIDEIEIISTDTQLVLESSDITITGDYSGTISTSIIDSLIVYNAIVNLSDLSLSKGNSITIEFAGITTNVIITEDPVNQTLIAFENEWREYEFFECRGFLTTEANANKTEAESQVSGKKYTEIVSIDNETKYVLNTGHIYTQEEINWLAKILEAKRCFIYLGGQWHEIVLETKKLETSETRKYLNTYNLKFSSALK